MKTFILLCTLLTMPFMSNAQETVNVVYNNLTKILSITINNNTDSPMYVANSIPGHHPNPDDTAFYLKLYDANKECIYSSNPYLRLTKEGDSNPKMIYIIPAQSKMRFIFDIQSFAQKTYSNFVSYMHYTIFICYAFESDIKATNASKKLFHFFEMKKEEKY